MRQLQKTGNWMHMAKIKTEHGSLKQTDDTHRHIRQLLRVIFEGEGNKLVFGKLDDSYHKK